MRQELRQRVALKGFRDGLLVSLGDGSVDELLKELADELSTKNGFLEGSRVTLAIGDRQLNRRELTEMQELLASHGVELWAVLADAPEAKDAARDLGLATRLPGSNVDLDGNVWAGPRIEENGGTTGGSEPTDSTETGGLLLRETLRSGRSIYHEGHVIVIGDVNPGAEIIAGGDVVVWGRLRGLVHAGALGDASAVICALELIPTQLRIADQIAISPGDQGRQTIPEMVSISDGQITARAWDAKG